MSLIARARQQNKLNERELKLGYTSGVSSWHKQYSDSAWIYAGGLNYDLTEGDLLAVFSQYGEILNINLVRDHKTGSSKGFCFICYEDQRSTVLATDNFNGITLCGRIIKVDHVEKYKVPKESMMDVSKEKSDAKKIDINNKDEVAEYVRVHGCGPEVFKELEELSKKAHAKKKKSSKKHKKDKKKKKKKSKKDKKKIKKLKKKLKKSMEESNSNINVSSSSSSSSSSSGSSSESDSNDYEKKPKIKIEEEENSERYNRNPEPPVEENQSELPSITYYQPKRSPARNPVIRSAAPIQYANAEPPSPPRKQIFRKPEPRITTYQSDNNNRYAHSPPRRSYNSSPRRYNRSPPRRPNKNYSPRNGRRSSPYSRKSRSRSPHRR